MEQNSHLTKGQKRRIKNKKRKNKIKINEIYQEHFENITWIEKNLKTLVKSIQAQNKQIKFFSHQIILVIESILQSQILFQSGLLDNEFNYNSTLNILERIFIQHNFLIEYQFYQSFGQYKNELIIECICGIIESFNDLNLLLIESTKISNLNFQIAFEGQIYSFLHDQFYIIQNNANKNNFCQQFFNYELSFIFWKSFYPFENFAHYNIIFQHFIEFVSKFKADLLLNKNIYHEMQILLGANKNHLISYQQMDFFFQFQFYHLTQYPLSENYLLKLKGNAKEYQNQKQKIDEESLNSIQNQTIKEEKINFQNTKHEINQNAEKSSSQKLIIKVQNVIVNPNLSYIPKFQEHQKIIFTSNSKFQILQQENDNINNKNWFKTKYQNLLKFGRTSNENDISFELENQLISRHQFDIEFNDNQFFIVCYSNSNLTSIKIRPQSPLQLREQHVFILSDSQYFKIDQLIDEEYLNGNSNLNIQNSMSVENNIQQPIGISQQIFIQFSQIGKQVQSAQQNQIEYIFNQNQINKKPISFGRHQSNEICLNDLSISNFHCQINYINGIWVIGEMISTQQNKQSTYGSYLALKNYYQIQNNLPSNKIKLEQGMIIKIQGYELLIESITQ